jgi:two-component system KDP operon response regulator KdpE
MTESPPVVLVVDDEVQIRRFLRAGLELDGFVVEDAETGADALKSVTLKQPDLVILDLGLPDMDGGDVLERLRSWSTVPLIVLSVRSNESEKVRLLERRRRLCLSHSAWRSCSRARMRQCAAKCGRRPASRS